MRRSCGIRGKAFLGFGVKFVVCGCGRVLPTIRNVFCRVIFRPGREFEVRFARAFNFLCWVFSSSALEIGSIVSAYCKILKTFHLIN